MNLQQQLEFIGARFEGRASVRTSKGYATGYAIDKAADSLTVHPAPQGGAFTFFFKGRRWLGYTRHHYVFFEVIDEDGKLLHTVTRTKLKGSGSGICIELFNMKEEPRLRLELEAVAFLPHIHKHHNMTATFRKELEHYGTTRTY